MCGCTSKSKISGMKKFNIKGMTDKALPVVEAAVGFGAAKAVNSIVSTPTGATPEKIKQNKMIVGATQVALGLFLATLKNKHLQNVGIGVGAAGVYSFISPSIDKGLVAVGIKVAGIGRPNYPGSYTSNTQMNGIGCANDKLVY